MKNSSSKLLNSHARVLRKSMTDMELMLWQKLRGEQLGVKFRRQYSYLNFVLDFVCLELKLVIELDGSQHVDAQSYDDYRTKCLNDAGFIVLRFWNNQVNEEIEAVVGEIYRQVLLRKDG